MTFPRECSDRRYGEVLSSLGFSEEAASLIVQIFAEMDWDKQFETGKKPAPQNPENYRTGKVEARSAASAKMAKTGVKGDNGWKQKDVDSEMLSGPALPKGPANPQGGSSKSVTGMRMLG